MNKKEKEEFIDGVNESIILLKKELKIMVNTINYQEKKLLKLIDDIKKDRVDSVELAVAYFKTILLNKLKNYEQNK
jgi:hypothetical protein